MKDYLSINEEEENIYRVVYIMYKILKSMSDSVKDESQFAEQGKKLTEFIDLITLKSLNVNSFALSKNFTLLITIAIITLIIELKYSFLLIE